MPTIAEIQNDVRELVERGRWRPPGPGDAHVTTLQDRNATVTEVTWAGYRATGSAKRNKGERHESAVGALLANARAFHALADVLERAAAEMLPDE